MSCCFLIHLWNSKQTFLLNFMQPLPIRLRPQQPTAEAASCLVVWTPASRVEVGWVRPVTSEHKWQPRPSGRGVSHPTLNPHRCTRRGSDSCSYSELQRAVLTRRHLPQSYNQSKRTARAGCDLKNAGQTSSAKMQHSRCPKDSSLTLADYQSWIPRGGCRQEGGHCMVQAHGGDTCLWGYLKGILEKNLTFSPLPVWKMKTKYGCTNGWL